MHTQSIQSHVNHTQANNSVNTITTRDIRQMARDVESSACDGVILIDAVFDELDRLAAAPEQLLAAIAKINCFVTCAKRHLVLIGETSGEIVGLTHAEAQ